MAINIQARSPQSETVAVGSFVTLNAVIAAIDGVTAWIVANFPKDGSGFLLAQTWGANAPADRVFTPAQLAAFRTQLDSLIATIA